MHINSISRYSSESISSHSPRLAFEPSHDLVRYFISSAGSVQFRFPMPSGHQTWSKPSDHRIITTCTTRYRQQLHSVPQEPSLNERNTNGRIIVYTDDRTTHRAVRKLIAHLSTCPTARALLEQLLHWLGLPTVFTGTWISIGGSLTIVCFRHSALIWCAEGELLPTDQIGLHLLPAASTEGCAYNSKNI